MVSTALSAISCQKKRIDSRHNPSIHYSRVWIFKLISKIIIVSLNQKWYEKKVHSLRSRFEYFITTENSRLFLYTKICMFFTSKLNKKYPPLLSQYYAQRVPLERWNCSAHDNPTLFSSLFESTTWR